MTQKYDKESKVNALKAYLSSQKSIQQIALDLGICQASLEKWIWIQVPRAWALWKVAYELCQIKNKNSFESKLQKRIIHDVL